MKRSLQILILIAVVGLAYWLIQMRSGSTAIRPKDIEPEVVSSTEKYSWLVGDWTNQTDSRFKISISANNDFQREVFFQVAQENDKELPMPTSCTYRMLGTVQARPTSPEELNNFKDATRTTPQFTLLFNTQKFELVTDQSNSKACDIFIKRENTKTPVQFVMFITKGEQQTFSDVWYNQVYQKK